MTQGIYMIRNKKNGKTYVGSSTNIEKRWTNHKSVASLVDNPKYNYPLYIDLRTEGINDFIFTILEEVKTKEALKQKEIEWYNKLNPEYCLVNPKYSSVAKDPYVKDKISKSLTGRKLSKEQIDKGKRFGSEHHNSKKVKAINKKNKKELIFNSYRDAANFLIEQGLTSIKIKGVMNSISRVVTGRRKSYLGYIWTDEM